VGVVGCVAGGCGEEGGAPKPAPETDPASVAVAGGGHAVTRHVDAVAALAFDLPGAGYHVATERFARTTPPHKIKEIVTISGPDGVAVTVDVWHNPAGLALAPWFERHLAFMRVPPALTETGTATAARVPAILVAQPRSEQAAGRDLAVFAGGGRVFRVTCHDRDDPRRQAVYARLLETFAAEAAR
jgi:hypothetical protein